MSRYISKILCVDYKQYFLSRYMSNILFADISHGSPKWLISITWCRLEICRGQLIHACQRVVGSIKF